MLKRYYRIQFPGGSAFNVPAERMQSAEICARFSLQELAAIRELRRNHSIKTAGAEVSWFEINVP